MLLRRYKFRCEFLLLENTNDGTVSARSNFVKFNTPMKLNTVED